VGEQDRFGPGILRGGEQGGAAGIAGGGLGPALRTDLDADDAGGQAPLLRDGGRAGGDPVGSRLQTVVDDRRGGRDPGFRRLERDRVGERERVRTAGQPDQHGAGDRGEAARTARRISATAGSRLGRWSTASTLATASPPTRLDAGIHQTLRRRTSMGAYDAVIEIPRGSRVKYEVDHGTGRVFLDRVLFTPMGYPANYGFFEDTLGEDGDPLDVLLLLDRDLYPGVMAKVRPVAVLKMLDEAGGDDKVVAVLAKDPRWAHIQDVDDLDEWTKGEIGHFFEHYKDLEPGKWVKVDQWADAEEAERLVAEAFQRFQDEGAQTATQGEGHAPRPSETWSHTRRADADRHPLFCVAALVSRR
jgi:inorganic pyrophosphatase